MFGWRFRAARSRKLPLRTCDHPRARAPALAGYTAPMLCVTHLRPCLPLVLLLAACPAGKGNTTGDTTADTGDTAVTTATTTTASDSSGVASSEPTTGGCAPIPCDQCGDGCVGQLVCIGSQASCECDCEDPSTTSPSGSTSTSSTASSTDATGSTGSTGSTSGEPTIVCGGDMQVFPEFDRSCAVTMDCALVLHQIDCCGSLAALGISADAAKLFAEAESVCAMQYPQCDCLSKPTVADDGNSSPDNNAIAVSCVDGECRSFVP